MLLFHKGCCNFPRIIREADHKSWGMFASHYEVSHMPLVHHHCLISWLWQKWMEKSRCLLKAKISKQKPSTEIIAYKSRSLSASVIHTGSCVSSRMPWSHAFSYKLLPQSSLCSRAAALSKVNSSSSYGLVQERLLSCGRGYITAVDTFGAFLAPSGSSTVKLKGSWKHFPPTLCLSR